MKKKFLTISLLFLFFNCEAIFVENISDENVVLLAPANNTVFTNGSITFNWQEINDAEAYEIQIATPNFSSASQIVLDSTVSSSTISKDLVLGSYEWRVRAINSDYATKYSTNSFTVN